MFVISNQELLIRIATFSACERLLKLSALWLSRAGYVYEPKTDLIKCNSCGFILEDHQTSREELLKQHSEWSPTCKYSKVEESSDTISSEAACTQLKKPSDDEALINVIKNFEKIPTNAITSALRHTIDSISEREKRRNWKATEELNRTSGTVYQTDFTDSGRGSNPLRLPQALAPPLPYLNWDEIIRGARHPALAGWEERRATFRGQEHKYQHLSVTIEKFVEAGLYYKGPLDNVRCFYCDGGLKNFKEQDDPWTEHSRWFADCKFVVFKENQLQGDQVDGHPMERRNGGPIVRTAGYTTVSRPELPPILNPVRTLEAREIKARLETPMIQRLLNMGYKREHIKRAIERRFALVGDDYASASEIVEDILKIEGDSIINNVRQTSSRQAPVNQTVVSSAPSTSNTNQVSTSVPSNEDSADGTSRAGISAVVGKDVAEKGSNRSLSTHVSRSSGSQPLTQDGQNQAEDSLIASLPASVVISSLKNKDIKDEELKNLWNEYESLKQIKMCKVCLDIEINTVFLPCGHFVCCDICTPQLTYCCICRTIIRGTVRVLATE